MAEELKSAQVPSLQKCLFASPYIPKISLGY